MTTLKLGDQYDDSKAQLRLDTDGSTKLVIEGGSLRDRAIQTVHVRDRQGRGLDSQVDAAADASSPKSPQGDSRRSWALGSFLLFALVIVAGVLAVLSHAVSPFIIVPVIVSCVVLFYLVAVAVLPPESSHRLTQVSSIVSEFMKLILARSDKSDAA
jgi:hypothetical protein